MLLRGLGASGDVLRATWSGLGPSWMPLGASGEALGGLLGSSWDFWEGLGGLLERSWGFLERSGGLFARSCGLCCRKYIFIKNQGRFKTDFEVAKGSQKGTKMERNMVQNPSRNPR